MNGGMDMQPEAPFTARLAYKCPKCDRIYCALCCHPEALVKEMLQPGRFSLPEEFEGAHPQAACPECRGWVLPYDTNEAESDAEPAFDENKPLTIGQRIFGVFFGLLTLGVGGLSMEDGPNVFGVLFGALGLGLIGMAVFSK